MAFNIIFTGLSFSCETGEKYKKGKRQRGRTVERQSGRENSQKRITESPVCILSSQVCFCVCVVVPQVIVENCCNARLNIVQILLS